MLNRYEDEKQDSPMAQAKPGSFTFRLSAQAQEKSKSQVSFSLEKPALADTNSPRYATFRAEVKLYGEVL